MIQNCNFRQFSQFLLYDTDGRRSNKRPFQLLLMLLTSPSQLLISFSAHLGFKEPPLSLQCLLAPRFRLMSPGSSHHFSGLPHLSGDFCDHKSNVNKTHDSTATLGWITNVDLIDLTACLMTFSALAQHDLLTVCFLLYRI